MNHKKSLWHRQDNRWAGNAFAVLRFFIGLYSLLSIPAFSSTATGTVSYEGTEKGWPSRLARCLTLDRKGNLWAAFMMEKEYMKWLGPAYRPLENASPPKLISGNLSSAKIHAFLAGSDGSFFTATENGLFRLNGSTQTIEPSWTPMTTDLCVTHLAERPDHQVWFGGYTPDLKPFLGTIPTGTPVMAYGEIRDDRALQIVWPGSDSACLVTQGNIWKSAGSTLSSINLRNTPLWKKSPRTSERRTPEIWIFQAVQASSETVYLIGHTKQLVRWSGGRMEAVAQGHFAEMAVVPGSSSLYLRDFQGGVFFYNGKTLETIVSDRNSDWGHLCADSGGALWIEKTFHQQAHEMWHFSSPQARNPDMIWSLGRGTCLSPGLLCLLPAPNGDLLLATNEGIWTLHPIETKTKPAGE